MQKSLGFNDQLKESGEIGLINDSIDFCLSPDGVLGLHTEQEGGGEVLDIVHTHHVVRVSRQRTWNCLMSLPFRSLIAAGI